MVLDNSLKITYHDGSINIVDESTKKAVGRAVEKVQNKYDSKLLQNVNIHVASDFSNLKGDEDVLSHLRSNHRDYFGVAGFIFTGYQDNIFIQETAFVLDKTRNLFSSGSFSSNKEIEQATMHEIGHKFDEVFGNKDSSLIKKVEKIVKSFLITNRLSEEDEKIIEDFEQQNGYSDRDDYMEALQKDLAKIDIFNGDAWSNYKYFIDDFFIASNGYTPTLEDIKKSYYCRGEIFAQLFSYLNGTDDGKKEDFLKLFPNTSKVVENYMNKHIK